MRANRAGRATACIAALVAACASAPPPERPEAPTASPTVVEPPAASLTELERSYRDRAAALARDGRWAEARSALEVLLLVDPDSPSYRQQYELAQAHIAELVAERLKAADKARQAGENEQATLAYLRVLSVDPRDAAAARALRELEAERVKRAYLSRPPRVVLGPRDPGRASPDSRERHVGRGWAPTWRYSTDPSRTRRRIGLHGGPPKFGGLGGGWYHRPACRKGVPWSPLSA